MHKEHMPAQVGSNDGLGALVEELREAATHQHHECVSVHESLLRQAADLLERLEPMDMALCERHALVLRVGQPYVFRPVGDCQSCAAAVESARDAYGDGLGAPNVELSEHQRPARKDEK